VKRKKTTANQTLKLLIERASCRSFVASKIPPAVLGSGREGSVAGRMTQDA